MARKLDTEVMSPSNSLDPNTTRRASTDRPADVTRTALQHYDTLSALLQGEAQTFEGAFYDVRPFTVLASSSLIRQINRSLLTSQATQLIEATHKNSAPRLKCSWGPSKPNIPPNNVRLS